MMIAIPNMDKPKNCKVCPFKTCFIRVNIKSYTCLINDDECGKTDCPLIDIVKCKDCKYWHDHEWSSTCDKHIGNGFPSDYFCADGKRRGEVND